MTTEILDRLGSIAPAEEQAFLSRVRKFTGFSYRLYQYEYPELDLPLWVITIGPDFIGFGERVRHYNKAEAVKAVGVTVALDKLEVSKGFEIGTIPQGRSFPGFLSYLAHVGKLQDRYTLFAADVNEWQRVKGAPVEERFITDDYTSLTYDIESRRVEVLVFDVLKRTRQIPVCTKEGVSSLTVASE